VSGTGTVPAVRTRTGRRRPRRARVRLELPGGALEVPLADPVVGVEREEERPCAFRMLVLRAGEPAVRLADHSVPLVLEPGEERDGEGLGRAVVDEDQLRTGLARPLGAGEGLHEEGAIVVNRRHDGGVDGRLCGSAGREPSSARRPGRLQERGEVGGRVEVAEQRGGVGPRESVQAFDRVAGRPGREKIGLPAGWGRGLLEPEAEPVAHEPGEKVGAFHQAVRARQDGPRPVRPVKAQERRVVGEPDPFSEAGVSGEDGSAEPLQRVGHLPGGAVDEQEPGLGDDRPPEVEQDGRPRVFPAPGSLPPAGREDERARLVAKGLQPPSVAEAALGPAPVGMAPVVGRARRGEHAPVELEEPAVLEVAGPVVPVGVRKGRPHVDSERSELRREEGRSGTVHPGQDQRREPALSFAHTPMMTSGSPRVHG
jgi:hypothetical protein